MKRLRTLFAAALAAGMLALAPPVQAEPSPPADATVDAVADAGAEEEAVEEVADTATPSEPAAEVAVADDPDAAMEDAVIEETPSPWSTGLVMSITAMFIGGVSAVLGIWVDRDQTRPTVFAFSMSFLILCALVVGVTQAYLDEVDRIEKDQDLERMLDMTYELAKSSGDPELLALVEETAGKKSDADSTSDED